jgi:hypothetical protein
MNIIKLLNQLKYRIAFSVVIAFAFVLVSTLWYGTIDDFSLLAVLVAAVIVFIPLTILWAIISTFFMDEEDKKSSDDVIDN